MLHKILNEEGDPYLTEQDKNSTEGCGSKCIEKYHGGMWTNILKLKHMLHKKLNEEGDPYLTEKDKNST